MMRIFYFLFFIFCLFSCQKIFHPEEISVGKIANYEQLVSAAGGVYGKLVNSLYNYNSFYSSNIKGDDMQILGSYYFYYLDNECPSGSYNLSLDMTSLWINLYSVITSSNNIICQYKPSTIKDKKTNEILGEMYLIRAYCYFRLTRVYGQIPLVGNIDISYNIQKPTYFQIYQFIESDLKMAMSLLPKNNNTARIPFVTAHCGSAKAILAEVYLNWAGYPAKDISKYAIAAKVASETIDSAEFFGLGLMNDFSYLWDKSHLYNSESVFSLYSSNPVLHFQYEGWQGFYFGTINEGNNINYGSLSGSGIPLANNIYIGTNFPSVEAKFYNTYPDNYRKEITFFSTIFYNFSKYDSLGNIIHLDTGYLHINQASTCGPISYHKFYFDGEKKSNIVSRYNGSKDSVNYYYYFGIPRVYLFRFAQTMLTYAEAMARSGQLNASAYEYVNQIRRRANHLDLYTPSVYDLPIGLSAEAFADSVVWERAWELCGEPEGRWFDLVRLEMVENLPKLRYSDEVDPPITFDKSAYFFSIPTSDTILNHNLGNK